MCKVLMLLPLVFAGVCVCVWLEFGLICQHDGLGWLQREQLHSSGRVAPSVLNLNSP